MKYLHLILFFCGCIWSQNNSEVSLDDVLLLSVKENLFKITKTDKPRNYKNVEVLDSVAAFINSEFNKVCDSVSYQKFKVDTRNYKNIIGSIGVNNKKRIIIGAHYDVCGDTEGADDNASGVVGLIELAKKLAKEKLKYRIDFVAYALEEPPFFKTEQMGSYIHAKYLYDNEIAVKGMLCLESIGYFSDELNSQNFPFPSMIEKFGSTGDFITIVQNETARSFSNQVASIMLKNSLLKTKAFKGLSNIPGVDFSDHLNYWKFNYDALMLTDTAPYRNENYHTKNDVVKTLDIKKMSLVIEQVYQTIKRIK